MQFKDKLDFLIKITQTSNKELAKEISVDPSLISLLRSGKRKKPHDLHRIRQIASFFAVRCTAEFQRNALADMIGQTILRSALPVEVLTDCLTHWLQGDISLVDQLLENIHTFPAPDVPSEPLSASTLSVRDTVYYYGIDGRKKAFYSAMEYVKKISSPCTIFIAADDYLDWLFTDYQMVHDLQLSLMEIIDRGFTICQIMPSMNFLNRYIEALRFWLPLYSTGKMKVYYYPRLRDNLYRHSTVIVPGHYVQASTTIGNKSINHITLLSTEPELVYAYTLQFQEHLALCRPALLVHSDSQKFIPRFQEIFSLAGDKIQLITPLSINTMPAPLLEQCMQKTTVPVWKSTLQMYLSEIPHFEDCLLQDTYIDMSRLATAEEVIAGNVSITFDFRSPSDSIYYTPEMYILHLQNILRLMEQYENYYFLPRIEKEIPDYNLVVAADNLALLIRTKPPLLMLELRRPEMVFACREHLTRMAEQVGYDGIEKTKIRLTLNSLIQELQEYIESK